MLPDDPSHETFKNSFSYHLEFHKVIMIRSDSYNNSSDIRNDLIERIIQIRMHFLIYSNIYLYVGCICESLHLKIKC